MKKIVALAAAVAASVALASAEIAVGARGIFHLGVGTSLENGDSSVGNSLGGGGAVFAHIPLPVEGLAIQPELGFTHVGIGVKNGNAEGSIGLNSLNIPVLVAYDIGVSDGITISPFAGPQLGIVLGKGKGSGDFDGMEVEYDTSVLFGILLGAEAAIKAGPGAIVADIRYDIGVNALKEKESGEKIGTPRGLQFGLGYQISF